MNETHGQFQEVFDKIVTLNSTDKIKFLEDLLFYFSIAGRGIWSDKLSTDSEKVEAFKWMNELIHRIWNISFELKQGNRVDFVNKLYENLQFYGSQSSLLGKHLLPTILGAFKLLMR